MRESLKTAAINRVKKNIVRPKLSSVIRRSSYINQRRQSVLRSRGSCIRVTKISDFFRKKSKFRQAYFLHDIRYKNISRPVHDPLRPLTTLSSPTPRIDSPDINISRKKTKNTTEISRPIILSLSCISSVVPSLTL